MAPSLDTFPDLCLIAIFVNLPLPELLSAVGLVCVRWRALLPVVLRRTLKIVQTDSVVKRFEPEAQYESELIFKVRRDDGSPWVVCPKVDNRNVLVLPKSGEDRVLTERISNSLMSALPGVTNLTVIQEATDSFLPVVFAQIGRMLDHWQDSLVSLTLVIADHPFVFLKPDCITPFTQSLFESIDRLRVLRHLSLDMCFLDLEFPPQMTIFSRLNSVAFNETPWPEWMLASLSANAQTIQRVNTDYSQTCQDWANVEPTLASKFQQFGEIGKIAIGGWLNSLDNFRTVASRFTALKHLNIEIGFDLFVTVTRCLPQMSQLVHLEMSISPGNLPSNLTQLPVIPTVRLLTLCIEITQSHNKLKSLRLWKVFPNVQVLKMDHKSLDCRECGYGNRLDNHAAMKEMCRRIQKCQRLARQALTRFPHLHTIELKQVPGTSTGTLDFYDEINSIDLL